MLPIPDPQNFRFIYQMTPEELASGRERKLWRDGDFVHKTDNQRFGKDWLEKFEIIREAWRGPELHLVHKATEYGYTTLWFPDVKDLHGNAPFSYDAPSNRANLTTVQKQNLLKLFATAIKVGEVFGFTFADITCGNILSDSDGELSLIDFDSIVSWPLPPDNWAVWQNTLKLAFGA